MRERGNILFLILLAVVLFAALSYAVSSSMKGGGKSASTEKEDLFVAQLLQSFVLAENTMQRAMLMNNVPEYGFDMRNEGAWAGVNNTCTSSACRLFTSQGGGVPYIALPVWGLQPGSSFAMTFNMIRMVNVRTNAPDLVIRYTGVTPALCEAYNRALGLNVSLSQSEIWNWLPGWGDTTYSGTLTAMPPGNATIGDDVLALAGRPHLCVVIGGGAEYAILYTLIQR